MALGYRYGPFRYYPVTGSIYRWHSRWSRWVYLNKKYERTHATSEWGGKGWTLQRIAWACYHQREPVGIVDHIDRVKWNNKISNLRLCQNGENQWNKDKNYNKVGYKNVYKHTKLNNFYVQVRHKYKKHTKYGFETEELANEYAVLLRSQLQGNFAFDKEGK